MLSEKNDKKKPPRLIQKARVNKQFTNPGPKGHMIISLYAKLEIE